MAENSIFDMAVDLLKQRHQSARLEMHRRFKGKRPYRKEPVSAREQLLTYAEFTPDKEVMMRQSVGDDVVDYYKTRMEELKTRYQNG